MKLNCYCATVFILASTTFSAHADDFADRFTGKIPCATAEPCKVLLLTQSEEKLLMQPNGILDTAAQARSLDLGQFAVYLKTRIAAAPAGEMSKAQEAMPKGDKGVDSTPK